MSLTPSKRFLICHAAKDQPVFKERFREALRRRLAPNTGLHPDQLAGAIGWHGASLKNWLRGDCQPAADAVDAVVEFFVGSGDASFVIEIYPWVAAMFERDKEAEAIGSAIIDAVQKRMAAA